MDCIEIRGLLAEAVIGVDEEERRAPQEVRLDLILEVDLAEAGRTDDLAQTVDYAAVAEAVRAHVAASQYRLVERLAGAVAGVVLDGFPLVRAVTVRVEKPAALPPGAGIPRVILRRERPS